MSEVSDWDIAASNNNSAAPDGFPEGQLPSTLNDSARELPPRATRSKKYHNRFKRQAPHSQNSHFIY